MACIRGAKSSKNGSRSRTNLTSSLTVPKSTSPYGHDSLKFSPVQNRLREVFCHSRTQYFSRGLKKSSDLTTLYRTMPTFFIISLKVGEANGGRHFFGGRANAPVPTPVLLAPPLPTVSVKYPNIVSVCIVPGRLNVDNIQDPSHRRKTIYSCAIVFIYSLTALIAVSSVHK